MVKTSATPLWVFLAFSSINTRKGALMLIWSSLIFTVYCFPWVMFYAELPWVSAIFLIEDWSWFAMMLPMLIWYWCGLKWVDKHQGWDNS